MSAGIREVKDFNFQDWVSGSDHPVLVEFWAESSQKSQQLLPMVHRIASSYAGRVTVMRARIDACAQAAELHDVNEAPTLLFFKEGEVVARFEGIPSMHEITDAIDRQLI